MIDWIGVATNSVWVLGLAIDLAVLSYADWKTHLARRRLRDILDQATIRFPLWIGLTLFCLGVTLSGGRWWERLLWGLLTLMALIEAWRAGRARSDAGQDLPRNGK